MGHSGCARAQPLTDPERRRLPDVQEAGATLTVRTEGRSAAGPRVAVAIRAESLRLDRAAGGREVRLEAALSEIIYRGTNVDHVLATPDGQPLTATSIRREVQGTVPPVAVGFDPRDAVLLED